MNHNEKEEFASQNTNKWKLQCRLCGLLGLTMHQDKYFMLRHDQETVCLALCLKNKKNCIPVQTSLHVSSLYLVIRPKLLRKLLEVGCVLESTFVQYSMAACLFFCLHNLH